MAVPRILLGARSAGHNTGLCPLLVIIQTLWSGWGCRQEWQQLGMSPAALTGLGLVEVTVAGPMAGRPVCAVGPGVGGSRCTPSRNVGWEGPWFQLGHSGCSQQCTRSRHAAWLKNPKFSSSSR